ncbi:MAG: LysR family transcriptional regulator, partial [Paenibacillaceae bacterium]|nr:LysR family transcriptional regulator [Paenibacillaceae bacterium]
MDITYDYYRIFYYVATCKSFSKAAGLLSANQSNISRFINNLEHQLGCKLFVRSN